MTIKLLNETLLTQNIDSIAKYDFDNNKVFGSAYFVYQKNNLAVKKCYGTISPDSPEKVTDTTLFRLASMTKPISAIAALILENRGLISLDDSVDKYLPKFKDISIVDLNKTVIPATKIPTIRNLLSHTAGIGCLPEKLSLMTADDKNDLDSSIDFYVRNGLDFEPESTQIYSGTGAFNVLAKIIELVSQTDYLSFLKKEIFIPCNMPDTTFVPTDEQYKRLISMHKREDNRNIVSKMPDGCIFENYPCTHYLGGAGLVSTLHDYCNFAMMLLNKGTINGIKLVDEKIFNQLCTPQVAKEIMPQFDRWGLGVRVITEESYPYLPISAFGWSGAYGSHFWVDPKNEIFAVFMKNSKTDGGGGNESANNFEKAVYSSFSND